MAGPNDSIVIEDDDLPGPPAAAAKTPAPAKAAKPDPEPPAPVKHTHVSRLVREALAAGLTQADLDAHPSDVIAAELDRLEAVAARNKPPAEAKPAEAKKAEPAADPDEAALTQLDADYPVLGKLLRKALAKGGEIPDEVKAKLAKVDALEAAEQTRQRRAFDRALDAAFAALPEEYKAFTGEGTLSELDDPGHIGYRGAIYKQCRFDPADGSRAIAAKVLAAATALVGPRAKAAAAAAPSAYDAIKPPRAATPKNPVNGRFTAEEFAAGNLHRPNGVKPGAAKGSAVEQTAQYLKELGDHRGDRPAVAFEDDDLPE